MGADRREDDRFQQVYAHHAKALICLFAGGRREPDLAARVLNLVGRFLMRREPRGFRPTLGASQQFMAFHVSTQIVFMTKWFIDVKLDSRQSHIDKKEVNLFLP